MTQQDRATSTAQYMLMRHGPDAERRIRLVLDRLGHEGREEGRRYLKMVLARVLADQPPRQG